MWFNFNYLHERFNTSKYFPSISKIKPIFQPAIAGLICGLVSIYLPEVIGLGTESIRNMIQVLFH